MFADVRTREFDAPVYREGREMQPMVEILRYRRTWTYYSEQIMMRMQYIRAGKGDPYTRFRMRREVLRLKELR